MGQVTIKDVAREAGVSISTVSNALNDVDVLTPETKAHVLEVAERLHYIPNLNGRNLKTKATKTIGLFVSSMSGAYFGELADSVQKVCDEKGYELTVFISRKSMAVMANVFGRRVDGGIFLNEMITETHRESLKEAGIPMVFLDREWIDEKMSSVVFDSYQAGFDAATYLLSLGSPRIGYISGITEMYDGRERHRGFMDGLAQTKTSLNPDWMWAGYFNRAETHKTLTRYMEEKYPEKGLPDVIFAANDESAIGCIEILQKYGIKVPEQVKVLGCDDIELAQWFNPKLSTIKTSMWHQGELAARTLMDMLAGQTGKLEKIPGLIVERDSTKRWNEF